MFSLTHAPRRVVMPFLLLILSLSMCLSGCRGKTSDEKWSPHYRKAVEAYRLGDYSRAVSLFQKALLYDPSNAGIYLDIAAIYDDLLGDAPLAISFYEKYLNVAQQGEQADWARRWLRSTRDRLSAAQKEVTPQTPETVGDKDKLIRELREELRTANQSLDEEREKSRGLSERIAALSTQLSALREQQEHVIVRPPGSVPAGREADRAATGERTKAWQSRWITVAWLLCVSLGLLVIALVIRQRCAAIKERALLASIQASASGVAERIRQEDVLGKYFWVENDRSAGLLSFTEKDGEIHVCVIDGTTRLRSRGKGQLAGNVLTAELHGVGGDSIVTKFIFANKGRTVTAVWQGDEGVAMAAGTKALGE